MNRFLPLLASCLALHCGSAFLRAEGVDEDYLQIYGLIQQADALAEAGREDLAKQTYSEAYGGLDRLRTAHPGWNPQVVQFRLNYLIEKLGLAKAGEEATRPEPPAAAELADRIKQLLEQIRQLTADRELLQAKLKEALSAQPAALDPRELARSEGKIKSLEKDVEVLRFNLKKAETKPDKPIDPAVFEQMKKGLASANEKLAHQREAQALLTLERDALQRRLQTFADGTEVKTLREENESLKGRVAELQIKADEQRLSRFPTGAASQGPTGSPMRLDEKNVLSHADPAEPRNRQNRPGEGEATVQRAPAGDPNSASRLSLLGAVKVRQHKYDEALDLLSRSAQLDAQNPDTFQYLGVALSEKGLSKPAESAFRRAIQLAPENAEAHYNLAIVYATQRPPALELAREHYQAGLAHGHAKDPKLEQLLSTNPPVASVGGNASRR